MNLSIFPSISYKFKNIVTQSVWVPCGSSLVERMESFAIQPFISYDVNYILSNLCENNMMFGQKGRQ